ASLTRADADTIFFAACTQGPQGPRNPRKALCRFQFLEAASRLALKRWQSLDDAAEALQRLCAAVRAIPRLEKPPERAMFQAKMWCQAADLLIKPRLGDLERIFGKFSGKSDMPGMPKYMSFSEWSALLDRCNLVHADHLTEREVKFSFGRALMTVPDEMATEKHRKLNFAEFLEGILRLAN
ncbi:hypothetical protein M885DRAFT_428822, partial [Pelagophyceae sp. CCMP2097]